MYLLTEVEVVPHALHLAPLTLVLLHNKVVPEALNGQKALQAGIHVAENRVVLKADDALIQLGHVSVLALNLLFFALLLGVVTVAAEVVVFVQHALHLVL